MVESWLCRPVVLRYLGLFGSVCCAIDGFLFGAFPYIRPDVSVASILRGPNGFLIMLLWVVGLAALCAAWWYGRHLVGRGLVTSRWVLLTTALWILPMLVIPPLASRDMYAYACQGALFDSGYNPYVDSISTQPCPWLDSVSVRWRSTPTPYGPVFILLAGAAAKLGSQAAALVALRVLAALGVAAIAACLPVLARRVGVPVDRSLWLVLCCPLVPVHLIGGGHNDAVTVAFLVAGLALIAGSSRRMGALVAGGALLGLSISVKTSIGVVLPFAALFAVGGPSLFSAARGLRRSGGLSLLVKRGGTVVGAALGTLLAFSYASALGLGWAAALSAPGESVSWTSPPTAVGIAVDAVGKWFGVHLAAVPVARGIALAILPIALVAILWHSRNHNPLYSAGLACLALIFLAPITQPWYLMWPLALFAVTAVRARWLEGTIVLSMFTILPDGDGALKPLQVPLSFAMIALVGWVVYRGFTWLRGFEPTEIDFAAPAAQRRALEATP
jgi:alpha-1,6-mannosyltransferase